MRHFLPIFFMLGLVQLGIGQQKPALPIKSFKNLPPCDCSVFTTGDRRFIPDKKAQQLVGDMLESIQKNSRIRFNDRILVREANCPSPVALLCSTTLPNGQSQEERVILYSNQFLQDITKSDSLLTWVDRQVLAHEVGHHVFGHLVNEETIAAVARLYQADVTMNQADVGSKVVTKSYRPAPNTKATSLTKHQIANLHAQEIQADFFSVWLLKRTHRTFDFETFANDFDLINIIRKEQELGKEYTLTHPLFKERLDAMRNFQAKLQTDSRHRTVARLGYFANAASAAYINLNPRKAYYDIALVGGLMLAGQPQFSVDGVSVPTRLYNRRDGKNAFNTYVGLSVSRFKWQSPWRIETEVAWSKQHYATLLGSGSGQRLLENLDLSYLTVFPKASWSPGGWGHTNGFSTNRFAFFASIGPMFRIPLGIKYDNYASTVDPASKPTLQPSVSPRLSIGVEWLRKTFLPRGYKLAFSYEWQQIRLDVNPRPKTVSHNLDATLYYTFLRR